MPMPVQESQLPPIDRDEHKSMLRNSIQVIESQRRRIDRLEPDARAFGVIERMLGLMSPPYPAEVAMERDWSYTLKQQLEDLEKQDKEFRNRATAEKTSDLDRVSLVGNGIPANPVDPEHDLDPGFETRDIGPLDFKLSADGQDVYLHWPTCGSPRYKNTLIARNGAFLARARDSSFVDKKIDRSIANDYEIRHYTFDGRRSRPAYVTLSAGDPADFRPVSRAPTHSVGTSGDD